jgi:hypothetical protein
MRFLPGVALTTMTVALVSCARRPVTPAPAVAPVAALSAAPAVSVAAPAPAAAPSADLFQSEVRPLLLRKCAPCHEPGGQMHARMPFDEPATVREHQAGILRRLKAEGDPVARWLASEAR